MTVENIKYSKCDIPKLFHQLKLLHAEKRENEALKIADIIAEIGSSSNKVMGAILELYIDAHRIENAKNIAKNFLTSSKCGGYEYFLVAKVYELEKKYFKALEYGNKALNTNDLSGDFLAEVYNMLGTIYRDLAMPEESAENHLMASNVADNLGMKLTAYSNYLFTLHYTEKNDEFMRNAASAYQLLLENADCYKHDKNSYNINEKIRVGYISSDLHYHVVSEFVQAFFRYYDKERFEIYVYANCYQDVFSVEMSKYVDSWKNISGMQFSEIAANIYHDKINILVELGGHTANNLLPVLGMKPAPIQLCGIGYFGSTGMHSVDYFLSDKYLTENDIQSDFVEKIVRLPHSHWCYRPLDEINTGKAIAGVNYFGDPCKTPPAPFQKNGYITFGCFGSFNKFNLELLKVWKIILNNVPNAKLLLKGGAYFNEDQQKRFADMLAEVEFPVECLVLEPPSGDYIKCYKNVDIALDTFPYVGGGTTCDALYMGVPVITLYGNIHHSRFGYSILSNIGISELACRTKEEYIEKSISLANNKKYLKYLHKNIRRSMEKSFLMDGRKYIVELEDAYSRIWYEFLKKNMLSTLEEYNEKIWKYFDKKDYERGDFYVNKALKCNAKNSVEYHNMLALSAKERGDNYTAYKEILNSFVELDKSDDKGTKSFKHSLFTNRATFAKEIGEIEDALYSYKQALNYTESLKQHAVSYGNYLYTLLCSEADYKCILQEHINYNLLFENVRKNQEKIKKHKHSKIVIGYMSPDFRQHVMFSFYYVLLSCYDRQRFKVICYQLRNIEDGYTDHLKGLVDEWYIVHDYSLEKLSAQIVNDEIDILVDLAGHTAYGGLPVFAFRPAPIQISGLGWMETTGLNETDYFITDMNVDPPDQTYLTETPIYMTSQFCYTARNDVPVPQGAPCKRNGYITFASFNNLYKINDYILGLWRDILALVPKSQLLLKCQALSSLNVQEKLLDKMQALGIDIDRIIFEPATNTYMNRYLDIDIALDTYPYPGGGTTCDALYMGVPVVTLYGDRRGSRFGLSILKNAGLEELATDNGEKYIQIAVGLANDMDLLDILHREIRSMLINSPVMDSKRYISELQKYFSSLAMEKGLLYV